jgi:outer membrane protein assembly factor BamE (lipoprotein component of BamABCDE complex)
MNLRSLCLFAGLGALALSTGCHRPFTRDNYDMITVGADDRADVRHILGKPTADLQDQWLYDDLDRHYTAIIHFDDAGKVRAKEWMDSRTGQWEGQNPNANPPPTGEVRERHKETRRIDED